MSIRKALAITETAAVCLFFLQAIRALFSTLFGVIYDAVSDGGIMLLVAGLDVVLLILAVLTPLMLNRLIRRPPNVRMSVLMARLLRQKVDPTQESTQSNSPEAWLQLIAALVFIVRAILTLEYPLIRLHAALIILAGAALYIAYLLRQRPEQLMHGLIMALGADQFLRAFDYTFDPTLRSGWFISGLLLSILLIVLIYMRDQFPVRPERSRTDKPDGGIPLGVGLSFGAFLFLQTSLLGLPNAITRWTGTSYNMIAPVLLLVTLATSSPTVRAFDRWLAIFTWPAEDYLYAGVTILSVLLAGLLGGRLSALLLLIAQFLLINGFFYMIINKRSDEIDKDKVGRTFSLGLILFIVLSFVFALAFSYAYTLPFFRGLGKWVIFVATFIAVLPFINVVLDPEYVLPQRDWAMTSTGLIILPVLMCAFLLRNPSLSQAPVNRALSLATYNIHYGYNSDWVYSLDKIADAIEQSGADVVFLQKVDTGRVTSYNIDTALWLGHRLNMRVVYAPTLEELSGVALLSRYPLTDSGSYWLPSKHEQAAIIYATVKTNSEPLYVYGLGLGANADDRFAQLEHALALIKDNTPAVLGGDLNATPDSPLYGTIESFDFIDPFAADDPGATLTFPSDSPTERLDYIWLRGLQPIVKVVDSSTASDHRLVLVEAAIEFSSFEEVNEP